MRSDWSGKALCIFYPKLFNGIALVHFRYLSPLSIFFFFLNFPFNFYSLLFISFFISSHFLSDHSRFCFLHLRFVFFLVSCFSQIPCLLWVVDPFSLVDVAIKKWKATFSSSSFFWQQSTRETNFLEENVKRSRWCCCWKDLYHWWSSQM